MSQASRGSIEEGLLLHDEQKSIGEEIESEKRKKELEKREAELTHWLEKLEDFNWVKSSKEVSYVEEDSGKHIEYNEETYFSVGDFFNEIDPEVLKDEKFWQELFKNETIRGNLLTSAHPIFNP